MRLTDSKLLQVIEKLFAEYAGGTNEYSTIRAQAEFVGVSSPQWSRIRNGSTPLTVNIAKKAATAFSSDLETQHRIVARLMQTQAESQGITREYLDEEIAACRAGIAEQQRRLEALEAARENYDAAAKFNEAIQKI